MRSSFAICLLSGVAIALTWLPTAGALPKGETQIWAEQVYYRFGPFGETRTLEGGLIHVDGQLLPVNAGAWSFWMESASEGEELRVTGRRIPTSLGRVSFRGGDFAFHEIPDDPLRREFQKPAWLRGGSLSLVREHNSLEFHAGRLTERHGFLVGGREPTASRAYGFGLTHSATHGKLELQWDRQESGGPQEPNRQILRATVGHRPHRGWSWLGAARLSRLDDGSATGNSLVAGSEYTAERASVGGHLRRVSPRFRGIGTSSDPHVNEWGGRLRVHIRPGPGVLTGGTLDWARDISPSQGRLPEERFVARGSMAATLIGPLYLGGNLSYRDRTTVDPESLLVDQSTLSGRGEIGWRGSSLQTCIAYVRGIHRDPTIEVGDWHEDRFEGRYVQTIRGATRVGLSGQLAERRLPNGTWTSREKKIEIRLAREGRDQQRLWFIVGREWQEANTLRFERDQWILGAAWTQPLPGGFSFSVEARGFLAAGEREPESARLNLVLRRDFRFGGWEPAVTQSLPEFATIEGRIFEDTNRNGRCDEGEAGIPELRMILGTGAEMRTDHDGTFCFDHVSTGIQLVHLDLSHLPTLYLPPSKGQFRISLRPGQRSRLEVPIRRAASVSGRVVTHDVDGIPEGVPGILVRVRGTFRDVFTDGDGWFRIGGLDAVPVVVEIVEWTLADDLSLAGERAQTVQLQAGKATVAEGFLLKRRIRAVLQHFGR
ncbi:hypothetical protein ACFL6M_02830 [Candidatus Eisenbacteria bacterium]|uniref:Carboxypeptidase regulatory-like domain-containing protein n=1 Tax=Eiseniibacteriota bacterium TaxID=2212470 RepID=A0ABV6YJJ1_UNCEI